VPIRRQRQRCIGASIQSAGPADELGGSIRFTTGDDTRADLKASVDVPFGSTLRSRFSFLRTLRDGYVENLDGGEDLGSDNAFTGRGVLEWTPSDRVRFSLAADYTRERESAAPHVLLALPEGLQPMLDDAGMPTGLFTNFAIDPRPQSEWSEPTSYFEIYSNGRMGITCGNRDVSMGDGVLDDCIDQDYILGPYRTYGGYSTRRQVFEDQIAQPYENASDLDVRGVALTAEFELGGATLKSITAFRDLEGYWPRNADHSAAPGLETKNEFEQEQLTQELQLLGTAFGDSLDWILGLYYLDEEGEHLDDVGFPNFIFRSGGIFTIETWAAFAQGAWRMGERWELTAGARYTSEEKTYDPDDNQLIRASLSADLFPDMDDSTTIEQQRDRLRANILAGQFPLIPGRGVPIVASNTPNLDITETTPYVSLSFDVAENFLTYISYSRGYKSGGYEQRVAPPRRPRRASCRSLQMSMSSASNPPSSGAVCASTGRSSTPTTKICRFRSPMAPRPPSATRAMQPYRALSWRPPGFPRPLCGLTPRWVTWMRVTTPSIRAPSHPACSWITICPMWRI